MTLLKGMFYKKGVLGKIERKKGLQKQYFLSHLEIVKDVTREILRRNPIQTTYVVWGWGATLSM